MKALILATVVLVAFCQSAYPQVSEYSEQMVTSQESWIVHGEKVSVRGTVITGALLFTVHAFVNHVPEMNSEKDKTLARQIAEYAIDHGYLDNAYQYNHYSKNIYVRKTMIGVALIKIIDEKKGSMSGARFAFTTAELGIDAAHIGTFPLPATFTVAERQDIKTRMQSICMSRDFDQLFSLLSKRAIANIDDLKGAREKFKVELSLAKEIQFGAEDFAVYVGDLGKGREFDYFIPISVTPYAEPEKKLSLFFKLSIIDQPEKYEIYRVEVNFPEPDDFHTYMGRGKEVPFPVNSH